MYYLAVVKHTVTSTPYIEKVRYPFLSDQVGHRYLQDCSPERNRCHRLGHHVYLISSDTELKNAIPFACRASLTAGVAIRAVWETVKVVETNEKEGDDVGREEGADVPDTENYLASSKIFKD